MILHYTKKKRKRKKKKTDNRPSIVYGANTENWIIYQSADVENI